MNLISGLVSPDSGSISYDEGRASAPRVAYIAQDYRSSLLPWADAGENLAFPLKVQGVSAEERQAVATRLMGEFMPGVSPLEKTYQLSGGQQQLICLLRSAVGEPDAVLCDEGLSSLDPQRSWSMVSFAEKIWTQRRVPSVYISHDVDTAILLAGELLLMSRDRGAIAKRLRNPLPRPRSTLMLTASEHVALRKEIIDFLFEQGLAQNSFVGGNK
jgi:ABC-type nitrate/sulfonate/bicarbonate transport system ATPase subunit